MLFRFRICKHPQLSDQAQGWVVAESEVSARRILANDGVYLEQKSIHSIEGATNGTIFLTDGILPHTIVVGKLF